MFEKLKMFMSGAREMMRSTRLGNSKSGQLVANIVGSVIGVIMFIAVAIPVTQDIIDNVTLTGTTSTIVNLLPLFYAIGALLAVVGGFILGGLGGGQRR